MPEWLQDALQDETPGSPSQLLRRLLIAFAFGCVAALIHFLTCGRPSNKVDRSFLATLVLLAVLIALVTLVIADKVARAFSLAGALAIVRFRTVVEDTRDTAFVIFAVVAGMAAGHDYVLGPIICTPLVLLAAWVLRPQREKPGVAEGTLILRLAAGRPPDPRVESLMKQFLPAHRLIGLSTARGGTALDVSYLIQLPPAEKVLTLAAELGRVEGVQSVEFKGS